MNKTIDTLEEVEDNDIEDKARALVLSQTREIAVQAVVDVPVAIEQWKAYLKLTESLLDPSDYQKIGNKSFKKKSAWRKYARAFNLTETEDLSKVMVESRDSRGWPIVSFSWSVVQSADGRTGTGYHECNLYEKCCAAADGDECPDKAYDKHACCKRDCNGHKHWSHPGDLPATAHTRAKNRAISDLIGAGETSADEISQTRPHQTSYNNENKETHDCPGCGKVLTEYTGDMIKQVGGRFYCKKGDGGCGKKFQDESVLKIQPVKMPVERKTGKAYTKTPAAREVPAQGDVQSNEGELVRQRRIEMTDIALRFQKIKQVPAYREILKSHGFEDSTKVESLGSADAIVVDLKKKIEELE